MQGMDVLICQLWVQSYFRDLSTLGQVDGINSAIYSLLTASFVLAGFGYIFAPAQVLFSSCKFFSLAMLTQHASFPLRSAWSLVKTRRRQYILSARLVYAPALRIFTSVTEQISIAWFVASTRADNCRDEGQAVFCLWSPASILVCCR